MFDIDAVREWTLDRWMTALEDMIQIMNVSINCTLGHWSVYFHHKGVTKSGRGSTLLSALQDIAEKVWDRTAVGTGVVVGSY